MESYKPDMKADVYRVLEELYFMTVPHKKAFNNALS